MKHLRFLLALLFVGSLSAAEVIPPRPQFYFNDYASLVAPATATRLNHLLASFERTNSSQVIVAIFPKLQSSSSIEDYTVRVAQAWQVGQRDKKNGAILFVFVADRKTYLQVGYGLEGALPDILCKRIIENEVLPAFRNNDYETGITRGVQAILAAIRGEYTGTGRTTAESSPTSRFVSTGAIILALFLLFYLLLGYTIIRSTIYRRSGRYRLRNSSSAWNTASDILHTLGSLSSSSSSGSSHGSSSSDSFSSAGGSFGGGGDGGSR